MVARGGGGVGGRRGESPSPSAAPGTLKPSPAGGPLRGRPEWAGARTGAGPRTSTVWGRARGGLGGKHGFASQRRAAAEGRCGSWRWPRPCCWRGLRPWVSTTDGWRLPGGQRAQGGWGSGLGAPGSGLGAPGSGLRARAWREGRAASRPPHPCAS